MTTTQHPTHHEPVVQSTQPRIPRLVQSGAFAGAIAAVCTTVVAAIIIPTLSQRLTSGQ